MSVESDCELNLYPSNRLKLYYVDEIPSNIEFNHIKDILDPYDCDVVKSILEKNTCTNTNLIYTKQDLKIKHIYIENAHMITYAHGLVLLNKFPNAEIIMFLTNHSFKPPNISIVDTHSNTIYVEDLRKIFKKRKYDESINKIDAKRLLEEFKKEIENCL